MQPGLTKTFHHMPWPFKYDFGMACWFRAETFLPMSNQRKNSIAEMTSCPNPVLFCVQIPNNGTRIEISFDTSAFDDPDCDTNAATLIVTVADATSAQNASRKVRLSGCVLSPGIWYHAAVRLSRSRMNRFSLAPFTSKDEENSLKSKSSLKAPIFFLAI